MVLVLTVTMCIASGLLAMRKLLPPIRLTCFDRSAKGLVVSEHSLLYRPPARLARGAAPKTIKVSQLNHSFGDGELKKQVLFDNELDLARGEIVIMTGPSGSGKTTLLTLIGALRTVQQGSIRILGRELCGAEQPANSIDVRRDIGFIFQAHNLFSSLTAVQNVRHGAGTANTRTAPR